MLKKYFSFIVALIFSVISLSQSFHYKHFSVEDGLPSSEVYDVIQDNEGFMWFATDRGVARFDGYEFETYTTEDGLADNVIFHLFKDHNGLIWFVSSTSQLSFYHNSKIIKYPWNNLIFEEVGSPIPYDFYISKSGTIYLAYRYKGLLKINLDKSIERDTSKTSHGNILITEGYAIKYSIRLKNKKYKNKNALKVTYEDINKSTLIRGSIISKTDQVILSSKSGDLIFSCTNRLFKMKNGKCQLIYTAEGNIISLREIRGDIYI